MSAFRVAALLLPAAAAFLAPALWKWRPGWKAATLGHGALLALVLAWGLAAGASLSILAPVLAVATAFAGFALGLHLAAGQVASGLAVIALCSTLFLAPPVVAHAVEAKQVGEAQERLNTMLSVNPWAVLAADVFGIDLLRDLPSMYRSSHAMADFVEARPPSWGGVAAGFAAAGLFFAGVSVAAARLRRKPAP